jgi:hypothetical protein
MEEAGRWEDHMATLEDRVARLEAENRRLRGGAAAALALVAMALALGAAQPKPTRIKADIIEAGTILVDMVKANTVDSTKVLAGDLSLYDAMGSTSLKVTNTGDGPTLAFTNEGTRPSVQLELPQGTPARELAPARSAPAPSDPVRAADLEDAGHHGSAATGGERPAELRAGAGEPAGPVAPGRAAAGAPGSRVVALGVGGRAQEHDRRG